ncbi:MAG TPA: hypothetical protein PKI62_02305 [bacterium]|nr:hypothetical protein [bacterium]HPR86953.1 hypothetical protein [bacterium]
MSRLLRHTLLVLLAGTTLSPAAAPANRGSLSLQVGVWKPSVLDVEPSKPFKPVPGTTWSRGISLCTPEVGGFALRVSGWQWQQEFALMDLAGQVTLRHLALDLKYHLLGTSPVSPFVSYGAAAVYGRETTAAWLGGADSGWEYRGYALNMGAGIDFRLLRHWGLASEYQYLYADFDESIGMTSRYSGPKVTFKLLYLF